MKDEGLRQRFAQLDQRRSRLQGRKEALEERREELRGQLEAYGVTPDQVPAKIVEMKKCIQELYEEIEQSLLHLEERVGLK